MANETPKQALDSAQRRYAEHASGRAPLDPSESIKLRTRIAMLSKVVNPGSQNMWPDYSTAEKSYLADKAAGDRRFANNLGISFLGPVFGALPSIGRIFGAPENAVENLAQINVDLGFSAMGVRRVSPEPLGRPVAGQARGAPLEPSNSPLEVRITKPVLEVSGGFYVARAIPKIQKLEGVKAKLVDKKLPPQKEDTFMGREYKAYELQEDVVLYRAGENGKPLGQFFSRDAPISEIQTRIDQAVLPKWPGGGASPLDRVYGVNIPSGTTVYVGEIGNQSGFYVGGTQQIVVLEPWKIPGVQVNSSVPIKK
jgi:hypothetical protein